MTQLFDKCLKGNTTCLVSLGGTCAEGVQFNCPSHTYPAIPYCTIFPFLEHHDWRLKRPSFMNVSMQNGLEDAILHPIHHSGTLLQTLLLYISIIVYFIFMGLVVFSIQLLEQFLITSEICTLDVVFWQIATFLEDSILWPLYMGLGEFNQY